MRADNSAFIVQAARKRRAAALQRTKDALQRLDKAGATITFQTVAETASVSRAWLYREPILRTEIQRLRSDLQARGTSARPPSAQRASDESLQCRLAAAADEVTRLRDENRRLREQVAKLHGDRRAANWHG